MKVLILVREFQKKKKEFDTIKDYSDKLISLDSKVKLLVVELFDSRIVQRILVNLREKFEATIASLENTKDLLKITFAKLLNFSQAHEKRRMLRNEATVEGSLQARHEFNAIGKGRKQKIRMNMLHKQKFLQLRAILATTTKVENIHNVSIVGREIMHT